MSNVVVAVRNGDVVQALRRFKKRMESERVLAEMRCHEYYLPPGKKRRLKSLRAQIKRRRLEAKMGL
jgi:small subunit ribosomal protein S21